MKINFSILKIALIVVFFSLAGAAFSYPLSVPLPGAPTDISGPADYLNTLYKFGLGAGAALALLMIVIGGIQHTLSESVPQKGDALDRIKNAVLGLILLFLAYFALKLINPEIVKLKEAPAENVPAPEQVSEPGTDAEKPKIISVSETGAGKLVVFFKQPENKESISEYKLYINKNDSGKSIKPPPGKGLGQLVPDGTSNDIPIGTEFSVVPVKDGNVDWSNAASVIWQGS